MIAASQHGDWTFERVGGLCRLRGAGGLVFAGSAAASGSGIAGVDALGVPEAAEPPDSHVHIMRLRFRSRGFFSSEPAAHFALGLAGRWRKAHPGMSGSGLLAGRGAIIGNVSGAPNGCADAPVVQIESFYANDNALFAGTCSARIGDDAWYALELSADRTGAIAYELRDAAGDRLMHAAVKDRSPEVPQGCGGWWITHVFSDSQLERDWSFDIAGLEILWR